MSSKKKSEIRDRNIRHAFIYINILKTDLGLTFAGIAEQLNTDNYRTRDGRKFTADIVSHVWESGKFKYRMEYFNHKRLKVPRSQLNPNQEILNVLHSPVNIIYKRALKEAAEELNVKLLLNPPINPCLTERKLIESIIKVTLTE